MDRAGAGLKSLREGRGADPTIGRNKEVGKAARPVPDDGAGRQGCLPRGPQLPAQLKAPNTPKHVDTEDSWCLSSRQASLKMSQMLRTAGWWPQASWGQAVPTACWQGGVF